MAIDGWFAYLKWWKRNIYSSWFTCQTCWCSIAMLVWQVSTWWLPVYQPFVKLHGRSMTILRRSFRGSHVVHMDIDPNVTPNIDSNIRQYSATKPEFADKWQRELEWIRWLSISTWLNRKNGISVTKKWAASKRPNKQETGFPNKFRRHHQPLGMLTYLYSQKFHVWSSCDASKPLRPRAVRCGKGTPTSCCTRPGRSLVWRDVWASFTL